MSGIAFKTLEAVILPTIALQTLAPPVLLTD